MTHASVPDLQAKAAEGAFDSASGTWLERLVFNHRVAVLLLCACLTVVLGALAVARLNLSASFEKMIPRAHPFVQNHLAHQADLRGLGNAVRVVVAHEEGDIFDPRYLDALKQIHDELQLTPGVDRAWMKSLWSPAVRWTEVTEEGFQGGPVMPDQNDGSARFTEQLSSNIARSGLVGRLVGDDFKSSMVLLPLLDMDPVSGRKLDYQALSQRLEALRTRFEQDSQGPRLSIRVIGFAKLVGDLIDGLRQVALYFGLAAAVAAFIILIYTRCLRSTGLVMACSLVAVVWQLGLVSALGFELDPYSILVPFLVFAIGVSHGAQKMNGIMQDIGRGAHRLVAARFTFRRLFLAGLTALMADAVGFAVLMVIDIPVIQDLAVTASVGVAVLVLSNLILLPVLLSFTGVSAAAAARSVQIDGAQGSRSEWVLAVLVRFTQRRWAGATVGLAAAVTVAGYAVSTRLQIGDLDQGAPELRTTARYNLDNAYITRHYALSSDTFAVIVRTAPEGCLKHRALVDADRLAWTLQQVPGVQTTVALTDAVRQITAGSNEGSPKWLTLSRNQDVLNYAAQQASVNNPELFNTSCSVMPVIAYLSDHKAQTLDRVVQASESFVREHSTDELQFLLATGSAGIEAATNIVVRKAWVEMLFLVYAAVMALCFITFRDWRAVVVAVVPLVITSVLCEALMVLLGIGVKVATLPVIALGVGIGVDYALYLVSVQLAAQRAGHSLAEAYRGALMFTGKVVALVGVTLAAGVVTWALSPIKFQADMGILLAFMFIWNMVGAVLLIPALSHYLLPGRESCPAERRGRRS